MLSSYAGFGTIVGAVVAVVTFLGVYGYCIVAYGLLLGGILGWIPAAILAALAGGLCGALWLPLLCAGLFYVLR